MARGAAKAGAAARTAATAAAHRTRRRSSYISASSHPSTSCTSSPCNVCQCQRTAAGCWAAMVAGTATVVAARATVAM
eukprot:scaffold67504_cov72-Phaeocystis_antarctica.AAC.1